MMMRPTQIIGHADDPYMLRWWIFRYRNWPRIYVHKFVRSDDVRAPHNHPWWFVSIILWGRYIEHRWINDEEQLQRRRAGSIAYRPLSTEHRVELIEQRPCWTLMITGPDVRGWGFWCRRRGWGGEVVSRLFVPWREFNGCGE